MKKQTSKTKAKEPAKYTALQICNKFCLIGTDRSYVKMRHKNEHTTLKQWKLIFKNEGLTL